tara:strand:- start:128 stop:418 length:291 start_codon:yes stop_codon:yes gene_type:complete
MKLIELHNFGDDGFQHTERGTPSPCIGEVVIKVHAASLNFRDFMIAKGLYNPNIELPLVPLSDGAGDVFLQKLRKKQQQETLRQKGIPWYKRIFSG